MQVVMVVLAVAFGVFILGVLNGVTGEDRIELPASIESVDPLPDAGQVRSQGQVRIDLADGYTGVFIIDGTELETVDIDKLSGGAVDPGTQVDVPPVTIFEPGNNTLTFTPSTGAEIETFTEGVHEVEVLYWKADSDRSRSATYTWTFNVV